MAARLDITGSAYVRGSDQGGVPQEIARLDGGAGALLAGSAPPSLLRVEAAIERAEDWLMPHAKALAGETLEVHDRRGRLVSGLGGAAAFSPEQIEDEFRRIVEVRTLGGLAPAFVADLVLVRELVHHGRLVRVVLRGVS